MSAWLVVAVAITLGAVVKGITGMGLPPVALPVMAIFLGVEDAVVVMAIPTVVTNFALLVDNWEYRRDNPVLGRMVVAAAIGGTLGAWLLTNLDERAIAVLMAVLVGAYVLAWATGSDWTLSRRVTEVSSVPVGLVGGVLQGATGLSGPWFGSYLHAMRLSPATFVFSIAALFQFSAATQVVGLAALGRYDARLFGLSVLAATLAVAVVIGVRTLAPSVPRRVFDVLVMAVLVGSVVAMLYDSFS
jgi:uncharacterized membrane protein YfcA